VVFVINGVDKHDWLEAFMFGLSVAVGPHARDAAADRHRQSRQGRHRHVESAKWW